MRRDCANNYRSFILMITRVAMHQKIAQAFKQALNYSRDDFHKS